MLLVAEGARFFDSNFLFLFQEILSILLILSNLNCYFPFHLFYRILLPDSL